MGLRGPKPTPTALLRLTGSRHAEDRPNEPQTEASVPDCPVWVLGAAREHWPVIASMLAGLGVMAEVHAVALGLLVTALGRYIDLEKKVAENGYTLETKKGIFTHPHVKAMDKSWEQVLKALREFGMTPSALRCVEAVKSPKSAIASRTRDIA